MPTRALKPLPRDADALISFVDGWQPRRIVVAGDYMLDRYTYGNAERLSPDAPVPVLGIERQSHNAGGASNVCLDLIALRCKVACLGVVGRDDTADLLKSTLKDAGCQTGGLIAASDRPTTVKHNFVGLAQHRHPQKMFRVDDERKDPIESKTVERLLKKAESLLAKADVLCLEDYNKGVLTKPLCRGLIELAARHNVPVIVDPAAIDDYSKYAGATCITPNRTEAANATATPFHLTEDPAVLRRMARQLQKRLKLDVIMLTLDKQGLLLAEKGKPPRLVPTTARSVYDVTGAGDMVLAIAAAARANDADWPTVTHLANTAAGLEVEKFGIVPIELDELLVELLTERHEKLGKLRQLDQLLTELKAYRKQGRRIAFTNGCFDILHAGHVAYLREASKQGDLLVVGVNSDASIRRIKGEGRPVNHEDDRMMVLSELQSIDYLIVFDDDTPTKLIEAIRPDVLVKGADYQKTEVVGHEIVERYGGRIYLAPVIKGRSTTNIIRRIAANGD